MSSDVGEVMERLENDKRKKGLRMNCDVGEGSNRRVGECAVM